MPAKKKRRVTLALLLAYLPLALIYVTFSGQLGAADWRTASREPAGLAPDPAVTARGGGAGVLGARRGLARLVRRAHLDRGEAHQRARIHRARSDRLAAAARRYRGGRAQPRAGWLLVRQPPGVVRRHPRRRRRRHHRPHRGGGEGISLPRPLSCLAGPNSNTFTAFILRRVPELRVDLPPTAIGKDYLGWRSVNKTPSGTGAQASLFGVVGVAAGLEEGLEVNLLGLTFGVDPKSLSIKLPIVGRIGPHPVPKPVTIPSRSSSS